MQRTKGKVTICPLTGCVITIKTIGIIVMIIGLIMLPVFISIKYSNQWTLLTNILFQIGLCLISIWFGIEQVTWKSNSKWLHSASFSYNTLNTIKSQLARLSQHQEKSCTDATSIMKDDSIKKMILNTCDVSKMTFESISEMIDNNLDFLVKFMRANCSNEECVEIFEKYTNPIENVQD